MLRLLSIRDRLFLLLMLLVASLVFTNLLLINQTRNLEHSIRQQAHNIDRMVKVDAAVKTFGDLKYWLTAWALNVDAHAEKRAKDARDLLNGQLSELKPDLPEVVADVPGQAADLVSETSAAAEAFARDNYAVAKGLIRRGHGHVLAVDAKLSTVVGSLQEKAQSAAARALRETSQDVQTALWIVVLVSLVAATLTFLIVRSVVMPLRQVGGVIGAMSAGEMDVPLPPASRDEIGDMVQVLTLFRENVARRRAIEQDLREVLDAIEYGILFMDSNLQIRIDNRAYREIWGIPESFLAQKPHLRELMEYNREHEIYDVPEGGWENYVEGRIDSIQKGSIPPTELHRADGKIIQYQCVALPDGGRMLTYFDITEIKRAEQALRESEERYALAMMGANEGLWDWDSRANEIYVSPRFKTIFGMETEALKITPADWEACIHPDDRAHYRQAFQAHLRGDTEFYQSECRVLLPDGAQRWVRMRGIGLRDERGRVYRMAGSVGDITAGKQAEIELRQAKDEAMQASNAKTQFLANMSHELRTPLNAILGYTELILDQVYGEVPDQTRDVLERVEQSGRHLLGLINDVLDLSKIEAGRFTLPLADYSMQEVVGNVISTVESLGAEKNLALNVSLPPDLPIGRGNEQRITQVLLNLIGNAIKFTDVGEVSVEVTVSDENFVVSVSDTGIGISEADQAEIFKEFQQADNSVTRERGGTGLGLAIARRMIEIQGGRVWVQSTRGKGSTFSFSLPIRVEPQPEAT
ncbi:MAG: ATP-binding protein [Acidiferrobacterales bacterium]